jgi:ssRNA-specific RNase YbeY (16S rRNA maturation enzyme)
MVTFFSVERVQENAADFKVPLKRKYEVMVHGVLHYADTRTRRSGRAIDAL